ncbi:MAG: UDP-N-acetylglucosamine 1-carboxyvinyltransferase [Rikenellaceae bacterium]|nr:UDP-N-acetylglucosamine 1-carboxyvinyltransferase [Rikenellaceae bacterium]MDI3545204.1 UDP-N-acetylglucosamine 1-carboxyvinyltransferase [Rikenellaceae bacterium]MDN5356349.1 UDP-N-acetylglucosamine 1-carboxyvinyltransferase [Rikenellaceae bacterium]
MSDFIVKGGKQLKGEVESQGAKNEALQVICACLLTDEKVNLYNVPLTRDIMNLLNLIHDIGIEVCIEREKNAVSICSKNINLAKLDDVSIQKRQSLLRGSLMLAGPILARYKKAIIPKIGGDKIGRRRIDTHLYGFEKLGAEIEFDFFTNKVILRAKDGLKGNYIMMPEASVTGTANIIMAAVLAEGTTTIYNAACEPYIQQLCKMLISMGAYIEGVGSNLLKIYGVKKLNGTSHTLLADMIDVGSFIGLAALTQSNITIKNCNIHHLGIIPETFRKLGIILLEDNDDLIIPYQDTYEVSQYIDGGILTISDAPWPGFTPDLLSIVLVAATQARGTVLIHQKMFESRLFFVDNLIEMGAQIILCDPHRATVIGLERRFPLRAITMSSPDIRAGISLLIAALSAKGTSIIHNIEQIERGYENIDKRLQKLGAEIERQ